jgi:hypothetical protein
MYKSKTLAMPFGPDNWDITSFEVNIPINVCKLISGHYVGPYQVIPVTEIIHRNNTRAFLVMVETHIDDYFDCITESDLVSDDLGKLKTLMKKYLKL